MNRIERWMMKLFHSLQLSYCLTLMSHLLEFNSNLIKNQLHTIYKHNQNLIPMKILEFTKKDIRAFAALCFMMVSMMMSSFATSVDCSLICSGNLIAPITDQETCEVTLSYKDLLPDPCFDDGYGIEILNLNNQVIASGQNSVTVALVGQYKFKIGHMVNGEMQYCWGNITFEDKKGPIKNLQETAETNTYICDSGVKYPDPSGVADLALEMVSCVVVEEYGDEAIEPWFDVLSENDFKDCSGIDQVFSFTEKFEFCEFSEYSLDVQDELLKVDFPSGWTFQSVYKRSWFASDITGRLSDTCSQLVVVLRPKEASIVIPSIVEIECNSDADLSIKESYPRFEDLSNNEDFLTCPQSAGEYIFLEPENHYCKYVATLEAGDRLKTCEDDVSDVFKVLNKWTVIDWCTGEPIFGNGGEDKFKRYISAIEVVDTEEPVLVKLGEHAQNTDLFDCTSDVIIAAARWDDCVGALTYETVVEWVEVIDHQSSTLERIVLDSNGGSIDDVPVGVTLLITYSATDACGNTGIVNDKLVTIDTRTPVCIANDEINVSMIRTDLNDPTKLGARVYGEDIDDTSRDNCYPLILEVRRADIAATHEDPESLWAEFVEFTEADLNEDCIGEHKVELRVIEDLGEGQRGLSSTCWGTVHLEDSNPILTDIGPDKEALCIHPQPAFDMPNIIGCYDGVDQVVDTLIDDPCAYHEVLRLRKTWKPFKYIHDVKNFSGIISQDIIIKNVHDTRFTFPVDVKIDCADGDGAIPDPVDIDDIIDEEGCANWLMEVSEREFATNDPDACRKILRTYSFINWCTWDPTFSEIAYVERPDSDSGLLIDPVVLHYADEDKDGVNDIDDAEDGDIYDISRSTSDGAWVRLDNNRGLVPDSNFRGPNFVDAYQYGYFAYVQVIKVNDDQVPIAHDPIVKLTCDPNDTDCAFPAEVTVELGGEDNCSELFFEHYLQPNQEGPLVEDIYGTLNGNIISGRYPVGTHNLVITTSDACGNSVTDSIALEVTPECKKPTPVCHAVFTAAMENGTVDIWASDIESGSSFDNCTAYEDLEFAVASVSDINNDGSIDAADVVGGFPDSDVVTLTCDHIGTSIVALWVRDEAGNEQFCLVTVFVLDNTGICSRPEFDIAGQIVNENDEEIDQVTVEVSAPGMTPLANIFHGLFNFQAVPMSDDVTITPKKDLGYLNGVSTSDLVLLQRHILGVHTLNSPYKIIAADANADESVDTRDLLHVSRLILGIFDELPDNTSWRFVSKDHTFTNPAQPWGFPEAVDFDGVSNADFIGIKIGDISGNAVPSNLLGDDVSTPLRTVTLAIDEAVLEAGQQVTVDFKADNLYQVAGYQFTLELDPAVSMDDLKFTPESGLTAANFGTTKLDRNLITVSWADANAKDFEEGTVLFSLDLTARSSMKISQAIQMNSSFTPAEAYDNDVNLLDLELHILNDVTTFELYQNIPNPVSNETIIGFNLPKSGHASLSIMDVTGKVLRMVEGEYSEGYNEIKLNRSDLGSAGVLYYQLDAEGNRASKKMIIID